MSPTRFLLVTGFPRSGTTLLTAMLDAHPAVQMYYEPFNARGDAPPPVPASLEAFRKDMATATSQVPEPAAIIVGFKETTITPQAMAWTTQAVDAIHRELPVGVVWIVRDVVHTYLSRIEGARRWWGVPDAKVTAGGVEAFLREANRAWSHLRDISDRYGAYLLSYEHLVSDPAAALTRLMDHVGIAFDERQLRYHEVGFDPKKVMGDVIVAREPRAPDRTSLDSRTLEVAHLPEEIRSVLDAPEWRPLFDFVATIRGTCVRIDPPTRPEVSR